ncbi:hypothetical protein SAMN02194393_04745 [Maledivibacter halophilus]|uniref:Uncharacterized protein n=1 Tax=Maledivibacter halophilus TaxID=36842 RepID=A0A1T5MIP4_9FIRM|nr:hypothetical protein SAMN02194393_04745 [Maledivibacter halophilus]
MLLGVPFEEKLKILIFLFLMLIITLGIEKVREIRRK